MEYRVPPFNQQQNKQRYQLTLPKLLFRITFVVLFMKMMMTRLMLENLMESNCLF